jgi:hypothetical protein
MIYINQFKFYNIVQKYVLKKMWKNIKLQIPTMLKVNIINHIVKFHLPSQLQGWPRW